MSVLGAFVAGLFGKELPKKKPVLSATEKNEINATLSRICTCAKRLETVDSFDRYITEWDKYMIEVNLLQDYEARGIKFSESPSQVHQQLLAMVPRIEKDILMRAYDRMQRDAAKLTTAKGKQKKADAFFGELEFYYPRLKSETVELAKKLKEQTKYIASPADSSFEQEQRYCTKCGALLDNDADFCGKCGNKI